MNTMSYYHNFQGRSHYYPLQEQTSNIKKVKSNQNILPKCHIRPPAPQNLKENVPNPPAKVPPHAPKTQPQTSKTQFIEPGTPISPMESILATTCITQDGHQTYYTAKQLRGPALKMASQLSMKKQPPRKPNKSIPELPQSVSDMLNTQIQGYGASTYEGLYRKTNEDKISIYLQQNALWFSIFDGHGGNMCAQFLKDNLHSYFFKQNWKKDVPSALKTAFAEAENEWKRKGDSSGSCALVVFICDSHGYVANLGDSRAVLISEQFNRLKQATQDHRPSNSYEQKRVLEAGGKIYQTTALYEFENDTFESITGPLRVFPGRMTTTRSFGDLAVKLQQGQKKVVLGQPEVSSFKLDDYHSVVMASDGVWDYFDNSEVVDITRLLHCSQGEKEHKLGKTAQVIIEEAINRGSTDNVSVIVLGLSDPKTVAQPRERGNQHIKILSSIVPHIKVSRPRQYECSSIEGQDENMIEINKRGIQSMGQGRRD